MHLFSFCILSLHWISPIYCFLINIPITQLDPVEVVNQTTADASTEAIWITTPNLDNFLTDSAENKPVKITTVTSSSSDHNSPNSAIRFSASSTTHLNDISATTHFSDISTTTHFSNINSTTHSSDISSTTHLNNINATTHLSSINSTNPFGYISSTTHLNNISSTTISYSNISSTTHLSNLSSTTISFSNTSSTTINFSNISSTTSFSTIATTELSSHINFTSGDYGILSSTDDLTSTSSTSNIRSTTFLSTTHITTEDLEVDYNAVETEADEPYVPQCGQIFTRYPRIVGGSNSLAGEFPWAVSVRVLSTHFCGGTIINKDWILTAAHCVKRFAARYFRIRLGGHDVDIDKFRPQWDIQVSEVVLHPRFGSPARYSYDMALLRLKRSIDYREFAAPVCLPENLQESYEGWNVTVVGWGRRHELIDAKASILQKVVVPVVKNSICAEYYSKVHFGYIQVRDFQICAGEKEGGKDSCKGDSGGPLVVLDEKGRYTLVGVVSAGVGCGRSQLPGIYSRVSYFVPWILKVTGGYTQWPVPPPKQL